MRIVGVVLRVEDPRTLPGARPEGRPQERLLILNAGRTDGSPSANVKRNIVRPPLIAKRATC
jgi:hypothetical protein